MRIPPAILDEIKARLPVSAVVARKVKLRRQGAEYVGLSPFNAEKSPSFTVNDQKQFWHCFSSGKTGDIFKFLIETEGLTFLEAAAALARDAGVELPGTRVVETEERRAARLAYLEQLERKHADLAAARAIEDEQNRSGRVESASRIAHECVPIAGTRAAEYLIGRGMDPKFFDDHDLRFHPRLWHSFTRQHFPALVAIVRDVNGRGIGIWRIFLGDGPKGRAPVAKNQQKLGLGNFKDKGGAVRIGGFAEEIGIGEGIETSIADREIIEGQFPVWPALTAGGIETFIVPPGVRRVTVFYDSDLFKRNLTKGGMVRPRGYRAFKALAARYRDSDVEIIASSPGNGKMDAVDLLRKLKGLPPE